jgi:hemerythrin-like domain-containing protein
VRQVEDHGAVPDFRLFAAMLDYLEAFPERLHHPKENAFLFAAVAARCPGARPLVAALEAEHVRGDRLIRDLRAALERAEAGGPDTFAAFADAVVVYADFHWQHMTREEEVLLPLALAHLDAADWERIGAAFRANADPLAGFRPRQDTDRLFRTILDLAAAPRAPSAR